MATAKMLADLNDASGGNQNDQDKEAYRLGEKLLVAENTASLRDMIAALEGANFSIIEANENLNAIRVRIDNSAQNERLQGLIGDSNLLEDNYLVYSPTPQIPEFNGSSGTPFGKSALASMGVPQNNQEWGSGVTVAVLDTGVSEHPEFGSNSIESLDLIESSDGDYTHGTAVASLVAGENTGIAPAANVLSIRVLDANGIGDSYTLAEGIVQAVNADADIINMSLGSYGYSAVLENAVAYAQSKGVLLVASTGNDGTSQITYPARFESVIAVAAIDADSQSAGFSNYGEGVDIAAPGVGVVSAWDTDNWSYFSGTSASVPYVTGALAAILSTTPNISPEEAAQLITSYSNDTGSPGYDEHSGSGILNLDRIINRNQEDIYDVAISDFYLDYENATATDIPLSITIQNRGTEIASNITLSYSEQSSFEQQRNMERLEPNETTEYQLSVPRLLLDSEEGYRLQATIELNGKSDYNLSDNEKETLFVKIVESTDEDK